MAMTESVQAPRAALQGKSMPFEHSHVRSMARALAAKPFQAPDQTLPQPLAKIGYDEYRSIRFLPERALWRDDKLPFQIQFFHRGFLFANPVDIYEVDNGFAQLISYSPDMFEFGGVAPPDPEANLGFAGFRIHAPFNIPDYYDEVAAFLGASYFRAVSRGLGYGLSARGLAIGTGDPKGEEFPLFKAFWIERPLPTANSLVVHALLDSPSVAAAYRMTIRPGETTVFDVEMVLYPRADLTGIGVAPLTSMFFFAANDRKGIDDYRPAVHDSDGLLIHNGQGDIVWRPLVNPPELQLSVLSDTNPRGFGLMQRARDFRNYQDLESHFEKRPSLWVEPIGNWGAGAVHLVELPTKQEYHDNIIAFWRPREVARASSEYNLTYRLHWGADAPVKSPRAQAVRTGTSAGPDGTRLFVLDFSGEALKGKQHDDLRPFVQADRGKILNTVVQRNSPTESWRLSFQLVPEDKSPVELRARLISGDEPVTETWVYQWRPRTA